MNAVLFDAPKSTPGIAETANLEFHQLKSNNVSVLFHLFSGMIDLGAHSKYFVLHCNGKPGMSC